MSTQALTSILGFAFWVIAARTTSVAAVGLSGAAVTLMTLLSSLGMMGLGTWLIAHVRDHPHSQRRTLVRTALVAAAVAASCLAITTMTALVVTGNSSSELAQLTTPTWVALFTCATAMTCAGLVLDQAVLGVGRSQLQLERNTTASLVKIIALIILTALGHTSALTIFAAWAIGTSASLAVVAVRARALHMSTPRVQFSLVRNAWRSMTGHHALNLSLQAPTQLLPLVVVTTLSATANGYFNTALQIAGFAFMVPFAITMALFADAGTNVEQLRSRMRVTLPVGFAVTVTMAILAYPLAPWVLGLFGPQYATDALTVLRVLVLAAIPLVIKDHFIAVRRVQGRTGHTAMLMWTFTAIEVVCATIGAHTGAVTGVAVWWTGALTVEAAALAILMVRSDISRSDRSRGNASRLRRQPP